MHDDECSQCASWAEFKAFKPFKSRRLNLLFLADEWLHRASCRLGRIGPMLDLVQRPLCQYVDRCLVDVERLDMETTESGQAS